jgi:Uma2 family endonuclease
LSLPKRDTQYHTYSDYLTWSREHGDELIDGTAYVKEPPSPSKYRQVIASEICQQVAGALEATDWVTLIAPMDVRLPKASTRDEDVDTVVQPDVLIAGVAQLKDPRSVLGAPRWLVEVLSPSTARYDRNIKIPVYERAGVPEVWLVDFDARTVTIYRLSEGRYGVPTVTPLAGRTQLTAVPEAAVDWDRLLGKIRRFDPEV